MMIFILVGKRCRFWSAFALSHNALFWQSFSICCPLTLALYPCSKLLRLPLAWVTSSGIYFGHAYGWIWLVVYISNTTTRIFTMLSHPALITMPRGMSAHSAFFCYRWTSFHVHWQQNMRYPLWFLASRPCIFSTVRWNTVYIWMPRFVIVEFSQA